MMKLSVNDQRRGANKSKIDMISFFELDWIGLFSF
jgi:hypothetical protein